MQRYRLNEIRVSSAAKIGLVLGTIVGVLPTLFNLLVIAWVRLNLSFMLEAREPSDVWPH
jgi:TctA family transporter